MPRVSGKYELTDFIRAQKLHNQNNWFLQIVLYLSLGMMGLMTIVSIYLAVLGRIEWINALIPLSFLILVGVFRFFILPAQYRRIFEQTKELSLPFDCDITQQAIIFRNESGTSTLPWLEAVQYRADKHTYLIYNTSNSFHILPLRLFRDEVALNLLKERLRYADIPIASRVLQPLQILLLAVLAIGIIFMLTAVIWPLITGF